MINEEQEAAAVAHAAADCFKCAHRRGRSAMDPDIVWCEMRRSCNYQKVEVEGCGMFREATKYELERNARLDYKGILVDQLPEPDYPGEEEVSR